MEARPSKKNPATQRTATMMAGLPALGLCALLAAGPGGAGEDRVASSASALKSAGKPGSASTNKGKTASKPALTSAGATPRSARANEKSQQVAGVEPGGASGTNKTHVSDSTTETAVERALRIVEECQDRYQSVSDYTCTFFKRERIAGRLIPAHVMAMKVRAKPQSVYLKFQQPAKGREAIYVAGRHGGKVLAHDVGINKLLAGTLQLEPTSARAMEDCRHPITEAGIGKLLETVAMRWKLELSPSEAVVTFEDMLVGTQPALMIQTTHPEKSPEFLFHRVRLFIDKELGLPTRFEAYDWPKQKGAEPELAEEYTYGDLKLNVGLTDLDFDIANRAYAFGRF